MQEIDVSATANIIKSLGIKYKVFLSYNLNIFTVKKFQNDPVSVQKIVDILQGKKSQAEHSQMNEYRACMYLLEMTTEFLSNAIKR